MTEVIPRPKALDAAVYVDFAGRVLHTRLAEAASGYDRLLWRQAWQALRRAEDSGWLSGGPPTLWADLPGATSAVHGRPGEWGTLVFHCPVGVDGYTRLISRPNVAAIVAVDIGTHHFMRATFLNRLGGG